MKLHFIGVGGSGIYGVSKLAEQMGYEVTGCDLEGSTAYAKNIFKGHDASHLKDIDLVIVSPAVFYQNANHPEMIEAKNRGIVVTWQEFVGKYLSKGKKVIAVAGTHGKSTTTAMIGKILTDEGLDPTVITGANVPEWHGSVRFGSGKYFVIEADEFNNNFLHYHPEIAIVNNIEFDHPDFFKNEAEVKESFKKFVGTLIGPKILITEKDSQNLKFKLKVLGEHNQKNANMAYLLGRKLGIAEDRIIKSLEGFTGIGRRMELISEKSGIKIFDDYAHHPTAIKTTIEGLRDAYPGSKIWVIDEPHGFARTHALLPKYKGVFKGADKVIIGPIFKARDKETFGITPESVAKISEHKNAVGLASFNQIKEIVSSEVKSGDIILVMGAGKSYLWARQLSKN